MSDTKVNTRLCIEGHGSMKQDVMGWIWGALGFVALIVGAVYHYARKTDQNTIDIAALKGRVEAQSESINEVKLLLVELRTNMATLLGREHRQ